MGNITLDPSFASELAANITLVLSNMPDAESAAGAFTFNKHFGVALDEAARRKYGTARWDTAKMLAENSVVIRPDD